MLPCLIFLISTYLCCMSHETILQGVENAELREIFTERLELVEHKLKFIESMPIAFVGMSNEANLALLPYVEAAGGMLVDAANLGVYVIYGEEGAGLNTLMAKVPALIDQEWQAVKNNRVALIDLDFYNLEEVKDRVSFVEDLAEILHPGFFIFGNEGNAWIRFGN